MIMDWSWAIEGITEEVPRTTGPACINYMTNRRRWIEAVLFSLLFVYLIRWAVSRLNPIVLPTITEISRPHSAIRLMLLISMTFVFGIEIGFKFAGKSVINVLNPCHIQTLVQIYLLASKPSKTTIALFRIQMNNLNGPFLAFLFPEAECRVLPFEQATYWIQHALLYIIPVYIIKSGAYTTEDLSDYNWITIGVAIMLLYHFAVLNALSIFTGINLNHMLCAALADPFQGQNYRIAAVIHESILCPILNKMTVLIFRNSVNCTSTKIPLELYVINRTNQKTAKKEKKPQDSIMYHQLEQDDDQPELSSTLSSTTLSSLPSSSSTTTTETSFTTAALKHRHKSMPTESTVVFDGDDYVDEVVLGQDTEITTAIATEYTMPTTKID